MLLDAIQQNKLSKKDAKTQLDNLKNTLIANRVQHCDVKPSNLVFDEDNEEVLLIDNGEISNFGEKREVCTPYGESANVT